MRFTAAAMALALAPASPSYAQPQWIAPTRAGAPTEPSWLWVASEPPSDTAYLFREFDVLEACAAQLILAADNQAVAWLNGKEVLRADSWSRPAHASVTLAAGRHTLAIEARNDLGPPTDAAGPNPAGVIATLRAAGLDALSISTDNLWLASAAPWPGWPAGGPPAGTKHGAVLGPASMSPWRQSFTTDPPCPILRRSFSLEAAPTRAVVRIIGLGHYELRCNGRVIGDTLVNQSWSQYDKTLYWQEFDLGPALAAGDNTLAVTLGNSFWRVAGANDPGRYTKTDAMPDFSRGWPHMVWLDAEIETASGVRRIVSDDAWRWLPGPVTFSNIYAGEDFDARLVPEGWDRPGFDDGAWRPVDLAPAPGAALAPLIGPGLTVHEVFAPTATRDPAPGTVTYIFPQNCTSLLRFTLEGPRGSIVRLKPCEYLDETGRVRFTYTWGTGKDIWHDYTLRGGGPESHQILFCPVGAQYVQVEGAVRKGEPNAENLPVVHTLEMVHVRAACAEAGRFTCSSDMQNAAHSMIDWSIRSNMLHFPTDCPHREKNSWIEQDWHMARALSYRYDIRDWYIKLCRDIRDTQLPDGHIPTNSPNYLVGVPPHGFWNEAAEWGIAGVLVPWHLYEWYGDKAILAASLDSMARYIDYLDSTAQDGVITSNLGDWYDYGHGLGDGPSRWTPQHVTATAVWALGAATVARAAGLVGDAERATRFGRMHARIVADFRRHFYDAGTRTVRNNGSCQAAHAVALCADLVPEADRPAVLGAIIADLEARGHQQTVGEVMQVFLVRALAEAGRADVLHRIYAREERGGYGYMVRAGLTTLPESWDARPGTGNSMNHFMLGHLVEWHFAYVAGIRQEPGAIGWERILIDPRPAPEQGITSADASFNSPRGRVASRWRITGDTFTLDVEVPDRTEARVILPDGSEHPARTGRSEFSCPMPR